jgi:fructose-bisphosphate aldolase, class II
MQKNTPFVNPRRMLEKAHKNNYAVCHININNLEWTKAVLETAKETNSSLILAVSEGAAKYMGGLSVVYHMASNLLINLKVDVPVALHLDHACKIENIKEAIELGFSSVMFDGSKLSFEKNFQLTQELITLAEKNDVAIEAEIGSIGGEEDGIVGNVNLTKIEEVKKMDQLDICMLAVGINNIHGFYPKDWKGLDFGLLSRISDSTHLPLVLHGASGINPEYIKKSISLGISKVNINTDCQVAFTNAIREYIENNKDRERKGYDPRSLLSVGSQAIKVVVKYFLNLTGSIGKN